MTASPAIPALLITRSTAAPSRCALGTSGSPSSARSVAGSSAPTDSVNPFDALAFGNAETDRRWVRRSLPMPDFERLLAAAKNSKIYVEGISGPDRAALYLLAGFTGLRVGALAQLTPEAFT